MALVLADRVQETSTTSGTGTITLSGAVQGFQDFATGIGSGNSTFYTIYDPITYEWEVGIGTFTSSGSDTLSRDTVLSNSLGTTAKIALAGNPVNVFVTYPSEKSVNLDSSGNVSPLGTISSGTWQGTTVGVAYGGTGVTASSGPNSVVLRNGNEDIVASRISQSVANVTATGGTTALTAASKFWQTLQGTTTHTFVLPDATTLPIGFWFIFDNDSTGNLTVEDYGNTILDVIAPGGYSLFYLDDIASVAGSWNRAGLIPSEVNWGTNSLNLGGSTVVSGGTWQGTAVAPAYGGTGLTSYSAANYALYSTSASTLTAGTLPVAAGGTGQTSYTDGQLLIGNSTGNTLTKATLTAGTGVSVTNGSGSITVTNTAPDQTVSLTGAGTTTVTGTYPSFTITSNDQYSGTVTSVSALTIGTTGTDLSSTVANSTTTPVITLNVPTASASARGVLSSTDWTTFNNKGNGTVTSVSGTGTVNGITLTGTVTSTGNLTLGGTLSGIGNSQLTNSSVTFNGVAVALGASGTITANTTNALTIGTGLSGTSFNGGSAVTIAIDSTVATLSGSQTLTNKTISADNNTISGIAASSFVLSNASGNIDGSAAQKVIPSGAVVGTTDTQTLTNKTLTSPVLGTASTTGAFVFGGAIDETVFAITDGTVALSPSNGTIQTWTLGASRTPTLGTWNAGESMTLMINDGTAYTVTWTTMGIVWVGGSAPTLATTGFTVIELWRVGSTYYGALVGNVA